MGNSQNIAKRPRTPRERVMQITDQIFDEVTQGKDSADVDDIYTGILLAFNDINRMMPGIHIDPPSKGDVERFERDENGHVGKEQIASFVLDKCTYDLISEINKDVAVSSFRWPVMIMVGAPIMAGMTKESSEKVPLIGKSLNNLSDSVFASAIAVVGMLFLQSISRPKLKKG